jgi:hypothetical protein
MSVRVTAFVLLAWSILVLPQQPAWKRSDAKDIESGKTAQRFLLDGIFLEQPAGTTKADVPSLVLVCSEGKLVRQYGLVRYILWNGGIRVDAVIDGGKRKSAPLDVMATRDRVITGDEAGRPFSTFDLRPILTDLLTAKSVKMALRDDYGRSYRGDPAVAILVEFTIPDSTELVSACGLKL